MRNNIFKKGLLLIIIWALAGCSIMNGNYGSIVLDQPVQQNFEAFIMDPGMNYYYSGPDASPNAIIGLKKEYALDNDLWKPIDPDPKVFKKIVGWMQYDASYHGTFQRGFVIKDPQGKVIGVWYSIISVKTMIVKMGKENKVSVYTPELMIYPDLSGSEGAMHRLR